MSRIDELIQRLCPDGVEYKPLEKITYYSSERVVASTLTAQNYIGVDNLLPNKKGKTISEYVPSNGNFIKYSRNNILIGNIRPYLKKIWLATHDGGTNGLPRDVKSRSKSVVTCSFSAENDEFGSLCCNSSNHF